MAHNASFFPINTSQRYRFLGVNRTFSHEYAKKQRTKSLVTMSHFSAIQKLITECVPPAMALKEDETSCASITNLSHVLAETACETTRASAKHPARALKKCIAPYCQSLARSRGLCKAHGGGKRCLYPDCGLSDQGGGYCIRHGGGRRCKVDGCMKSAQSRQFCKAHGGGTRCKYTECNKLSQGGGFCRSHGGQTERKNPLTRKKICRAPTRNEKHCGTFVFEHNLTQLDASVQNLSTQIDKTQTIGFYSFEHQTHTVEQCIVRGCREPRGGYFQPSFFCFNHTANLYWAISLLEISIRLVL